MIRVHGHRGARAILPENTMPGFRYAIKQGVDAIELDVVVTKDDVVVVFHDAKMNGKFCRGPAGTRGIRKLTFEQLREWDCGAVANRDFPWQKALPGTRVPALGEVLALAPRGEFEFHIEAKLFAGKPKLTPPPDEFAQLVLEQIRKYGVALRAVLLSFDYRILHAMKRLDPSIRLCALYEGGDLDYISIAKEAGASIVSPRYETVTQRKVADAHAGGLQVVAWTANTTEAWDRLIEANVDAIVTDDPAGLFYFMRVMGLR
jgi:glycerophosphoryl diester phosphodiesterase